MKIVAVLFMMMVSAVASAQINKCIDKSGKVVGYGNECPDGMKSEQSGVKSTPPAASAPASATQPKSLAERDAEFRKRQIEKQEAAAKAEKKSAETEQRKRACDDSQAYLKTLQAGQRISRTDPKTGERSFLSDAEYPKEIANAERSVAGNCK
ncbi:MAG TPA: DUF4124 domain-containing protein [Burkholderiales bacterium]|jgi:hypothetical protein|nr:DUF4124 domain-containing protein [Burkholderiales bacterium]